MSKVRYYLDCEFLWSGELISMALAGEDGSTWYEVMPLSRQMLDIPFVRDTIIPRLEREPLSIPEMVRLSLHEFLSDKSPFEVVADWPDDLMHFFALLRGHQAGSRLNVECTATLIAKQELQPSLPHNALSDAKALRDACGLLSH